MAPVTTYTRTDAETEQMAVDAEDDVEALFDALVCRAIIEAIDDAPLTTNELSTACDLPLSTTYRKLDKLTEAGLLEEATRIRRSGKHVSEYSRNFEDLTVSIDADGNLELAVAWQQPPNPRSLFAAAGGR
ncbi:MAG: helix-turn-helix domain-containing protein [Salinigranum sp.]